MGTDYLSTHYHEKSSLMTHPLRTGSTFGVYWIPQHKDQRDEKIMQEWNPPVMKLSEAWGENRDWMRDWRRDLPGTEFVLRNWLKMGNAYEMHDDPLGTAQRHADHWRWYADTFGGEAWFDPDKLIFCSSNEPVSKGVESQVRDYLIAFTEAMTSEGLRACVFNASVGTPENTGDDTRVAWERFDGLEAAILAGKHYLGLHEYWTVGADKAPEWAWGWWTDRLGQCPWGVPILVGECGIDDGVIPGMKGHRGWQHYRLTPQAYVEQLATYDRWMRRDNRVVATLPFCYDFERDHANPDNAWWSFDIRACREELLAYIIEARNEPDGEPLPFPRYPDNVINPLPPVANVEPVEPVEPMIDYAQMANDARWYSEEASRLARDGKGQAAHDMLAEHVTKPLYKIENHLKALAAQ